MKVLFLVAILATLFQPANAQNNNERYEPIGTLNATINGTDFMLITEYDHEKERSEIKAGEFRGVQSTIVLTRDRTGDHRIAHFPSISFEIWPSESGETSHEADVVYIGEEGVFQAMSSTQNRLQVIDYVRTNETLSFSVAGELAPVLKQGAYETDSSRKPMTISGSYSAILDRQ